MTEKEKAIENYMKTLSLTREEAEQLWEDDNSDEMLPEVAELTEKAKKNLKRQYEINPDKKRKATTKLHTRQKHDITLIVFCFAQFCRF